MNVTSGIVKNRSKQAPWLRESYDYGWKEEWKRLPCNNCRGSSWVAFRRVEMPSSTTAWPAVGNRSTEQLPADRTQLEVAHFPSPRSSGRARSVHRLARGVFRRRRRLMPWLMKTLDHHTLGASPGTTSVNDFFRKRDRLKRSRARTSIKSM
jgi:hypothetical protein